MISTLPVVKSLTGWFAPRCPYAADQCVNEEPPLVPTAEDPNHLYACWFPVGSPAYHARRADNAERANLAASSAGVL